MNRKIFAAVMLPLCALFLVSSIPPASASLTKSISNIMVYFSDQDAMRVSMSITYDLWDGCRTIYVREVKVTFQHLFTQTPFYSRLNCITLETGRSPWDSGACVTSHWVSPYIGRENYYGNPPSTCIYQPRVSFRFKVGVRGACGTEGDMTGGRLIADGNYMWVSFTNLTWGAYWVQIAWQFAYGDDLGAFCFKAEAGWEPGR